MSTHTKLHGRAFYESIGSPKVILAPMVDQSEFAWRMLTRSFMNNDAPQNGTNVLAYTPMLHSRLYRTEPKYRKRMFEPTRSASTIVPAFAKNTDAQREVDMAETEAGKAYLDGNPAFDRPLTVQFCSNDPDDLLGAAQHVAPYCDAVDLNLGCPQGIAKRGHYGAFLQEDWTLIHSMIKKLHDHLDIPVTAKMRILETPEKTLDYARMIISAGASILTVHGRRREQKGHITGVADWTMLKYLRNNLPPEIVLFANGNILQHEDIQQCLDATGFDGVMSAEGNLSDPSVLATPPAEDKTNREYWRDHRGRGGYRMDAVLRRYLDIIHRYVLETEPPQRAPLFLPGDDRSAQPVVDKKRPLDNTSDREPPTKKQKRDKSLQKLPRTQSPNLLAIRPHLFGMLKPLIAKKTHVRDAIAKADPGDMSAFEHVLSLVEEVTAEALVEYESGNEDVAKHAEKKKKKKQTEEGTDDKAADAIVEETSAEAVQRCWRPWWICQPHVRPLPAEALAKGSITLGKKVKQQLQNDDGLARDVGLRPGGDVATVPSNNTPTESVEVPKEGLVCG